MTTGAPPSWSMALRCINVGQGDATIIVSRDPPWVMVVDCPSGYGESIVDELRSMDVAAVDIVVCTHSDLDHSGGIAYLIKNLPVAEVVLSPNDKLIHPTPEHRTRYRALLRSVVELRGMGYLVHIHPHELAPITITGAAASVELLYPKRDDLLLAHSLNDPNMLSIVLRLRTAGTTALLGSDLPLAGWQVIASREKLSSDIFRTAHHGGHLSQHPTTMTLDALINLIAPDYAVVSVGSVNRYGHPVRHHINALARTGCVIMCTELTSMCHRTHEELPSGGRPCADTVTFWFDQRQLVAVTPSAGAHHALVRTLTSPACLAFHEAAASGGTDSSPDPQ